MRRLISTLAVLAALVLAMSGLGTGVLAQEPAEAEHPIVGAWTIWSDGDESGPGDLVAFIAGGVFIAPTGEGVGVGTWAPSGERGVVLAFASPLSGGEGGESLGFFTIRGSLEVSEDGGTFSGTYSLDFPAEVGEAFGLPAGELGPGEVKGERLPLTPMGEFVGPIPDFSQVEQQPGEGSPAPEATVVPGEDTPAPEASPAA